MTGRLDADIEPVLHAAMTLVARGGLKALSLRPLADQLGSTVSALTHRFGRKEALLGSLIDAAHADDAAFLDHWLVRACALNVHNGALLADLADAVLADMAGPESLRTQFLCELLQGAVSRPDIAAPLAAWRARRLSFWCALAEALGHADLGEALHAFSTDEAAHGLALGPLSPYRWLRRLTLQRLCGGLVAPLGSTDLKQFGVFHAALGDLPDLADRYRTPQMSEWQAGAAHHISALILAEGADAVTHRAVAARANLPNSSLAYHFPRQEDLLLAGLHDIIGRMQGAIYGSASSEITSESELTSVEIARATFAIALVATRMPGLATFAADMRRRRGENYLVRLNSRVSGRDPFDLLSAQTIAMVGNGQLVLDAVLAPAADAAAARLTGQLQAIVLATD